MSNEKKSIDSILPGGKTGFSSSSLLAAEIRACIFLDITVGGSRAHNQ